MIKANISRIIAIAICLSLTFCIIYACSWRSKTAIEDFNVKYGDIKAVNTYATPNYGQMQRTIKQSDYDNVFGLLRGMEHTYDTSDLLCGVGHAMWIYTYDNDLISIELSENDCVRVLYLKDYESDAAWRDEMVYRVYTISEENFDSLCNMLKGFNTKYPPVSW